METTLLYGRSLLQDMKKQALEHSEVLSQLGVAMVLIEPTPDMDPLRFKAAEISANEKIKTFRSIGVSVNKWVLPATADRRQFGDLLDRLRETESVSAVIVQLPVAKDLRSELHRIPEIKDIDGITAGNTMFPICATAEAALRVIAPVKKRGQELVVVGGKGFVGAAVAYGLRLKKEPYVVLDIGDDLRQISDFELVISSTGQPNVLNEKNLAGQNRVVDVGFMPLKSDIRDYEKDVAGDVDRNAYRLVKSITPVPGGVGPLQMAVLIERMLNKALGETKQRWEYPV